MKPLQWRVNEACLVSLINYYLFNCERNMFKMLKNRSFCSFVWVDTMMLAANIYDNVHNIANVIYFIHTSPNLKYSFCPKTIISNRNRNVDLIIWHFAMNIPAEKEYVLFIDTPSHSREKKKDSNSECEWKATVAK